MINNSNIDKVIRIINKTIMDKPEPAIELVSYNYKTPFHILIGTILSARTKDETTIQVCNRLFKKIKNSNDILKIKFNQLKKNIYPIGFYNTKAKNLKKAAKVIKKKFNNTIPDTMDELLQIPGVGRKTANLVLILAFNKYGICVDTHVHRICNRWGYVNTKMPEETEFALRKKLPKKLWKNINYNLVKYGKIMCKPIGPLCSQCPVNSFCPYPKKSRKL